MVSAIFMTQKHRVWIASRNWLYLNLHYKTLANCILM